MYVVMYLSFGMNQKLNNNNYLLTTIIINYFFPLCHIISLYKNQVISH